MEIKYNFFIAKRKQMLLFGKKGKIGFKKKKLYYAQNFSFLLRSVTLGL